MARATAAADTAFSIALVRAEEASFPAELRIFDDPHASVFAAAGAHAAEGSQRYLDLPFFRDGIRLRTRFIDDVTREALASGIDQIVILGAGFDCRALRMPEIVARSARVYEVDFAAQLETKRALLAAAGTAWPGHVAQVACDFNGADLETTLGAALEANGLARRKGTLFIWEGVTAYIDAAAIDRSLGAMARLGGPESRVVFDFSDVIDGPGAWAARVKRSGFDRLDDIGLDDLWRRYLKGDPHPNAWICKMGTAFLTPRAV